MIRKGTYVLAIALGTGTDIEVGALGKHHFDSGTYCYVGSAMGGLDQRISRHISKEKRMRWHIDRLTVAADSVSAYESYPDFVPECELARMAVSCGMIPAIPGFGCSDCSCATHLFLAPEGSLERLAAVSGMHPFEPQALAGARASCDSETL